MTSNDKIQFLCKLTGKCCIHNQVVLNPLDIFEISKYLQIPAGLLFEKRLLTYIINKKDYWMDPIINLSPESTCPFLKFIEEQKYLCEIHHSRPTVCRVFPLNYNYSNSTFRLVKHSENRCKECFDTDQEYPIDKFINESGLENRFQFQKDYREFLAFILESGYTIDKIKGNEKNKERFFRIQKILYETYPNRYDDHEHLPWGEIQESIRDIIEF